MLKEIIRILTDKKTMVDEMGVEFESMLKIGKDMFVAVTDLLYLGGDKKVVHKKIFPADKELNKLECKIRGEVVTHISVAGADNLSSMLIFMSVVKDAERIGDYIKNLYDIAEKAKDFGKGKYGEATLDIRNHILMNFDLVNDAFNSGSTKKAKSILKEIAKLQKKCDKIVNELLNKCDAKERSVAYALTARFYKRILAHLSNIVTSVVMPVNKLDYFDDDNLDKLKRT